MWEHLEILRECDKLQPAAERVCPRITDAHIDVMKNSFAKMRVSLVLQVGAWNNFIALFLLYFTMKHSLKIINVITSIIIRNFRMDAGFQQIRSYRFKILQAIRKKAKGL